MGSEPEDQKLNIDQAPQANKTADKSPAILNCSHKGHPSQPLKTTHRNPPQNLQVLRLVTSACLGVTYKACYTIHQFLHCLVLLFTSVPNTFKSPYVLLLSWMPPGYTFSPFLWNS